MEDHDFDKVKRTLQSQKVYDGQSARRIPGFNLGRQKAKNDDEASFLFEEENNQSKGSEKEEPDCQFPDEPMEFDEFFLSRGGKGKSGVELSQLYSFTTLNDQAFMHIMRLRSAQLRVDFDVVFPHVLESNYKLWERKVDSCISWQIQIFDFDIDETNSTDLYRLPKSAEKLSDKEMLKKLKTTEPKDLFSSSLIPDLLNLIPKPEANTSVHYRENYYSTSISKPRTLLLVRIQSFLSKVIEIIDVFTEVYNVDYSCIDQTKNDFTKSCFAKYMKIIIDHFQADIKTEINRSFFSASYNWKEISRKLDTLKIAMAEEYEGQIVRIKKILQSPEADKSRLTEQRDELITETLAHLHSFHIEQFKQKVEIVEDLMADYFWEPSEWDLKLREEFKDCKNTILQQPNHLLYCPDLGKSIRNSLAKHFKGLLVQPDFLTYFKSVPQSNTLSEIKANRWRFSLRLLQALSLCDLNVSSANQSVGHLTELEALRQLFDIVSQVSHPKGGSGESRQSLKEAVSRLWDVQDRQSEASVEQAALHMLGLYAHFMDLDLKSLSSCSHARRPTQSVQNLARRRQLLRTVFRLFDGEEMVDGCTHLYYLDLLLHTYMEASATFVAEKGFLSLAENFPREKKRAELERDIFAGVEELTKLVQGKDRALPAGPVLWRRGLCTDSVIAVLGEKGEHKEYEGALLDYYPFTEIIYIDSGWCPSKEYKDFQKETVLQKAKDLIVKILELLKHTKAEVLKASASNSQHIGNPEEPGYDDRMQLVQENRSISKLQEGREWPYLDHFCNGLECLLQIGGKVTNEQWLAGFFRRLSKMELLLFTRTIASALSLKKSVATYLLDKLYPLLQKLEIIAIFCSEYPREDTKESKGGASWVFSYLMNSSSFGQADVSILSIRKAKSMIADLRTYSVKKRDAEEKEEQHKLLDVCVMALDEKLEDEDLFLGSEEIEALNLPRVAIVSASFDQIGDRAPESKGRVKSVLNGSSDSRVRIEALLHEAGFHGLEANASN